MPPWKKIVRDYFTFNRRERQGLYVLLCVLMGILATHLFIHLNPKPFPDLTTEQQAKLTAFQSSQNRSPAMEVVADSTVSEVSLVNDSTTFESEAAVHMFPFDPNEVSVEELKSLGLEEWRAKAFINYRNAGVRFYNVEKVSGVKTLPGEWLDRAELWMRFPEALVEEQSEDTLWKEPKAATSKPKSIVAIELNRADSAALVTLPWVGGYYAAEIVKLRSALGGFFSYDQLLDVYKIREETMESIVEHSTLDTALVRKINVNECEIEQLGRHPYISWRAARSVVNYRKQHGAFVTLDGIKSTDAVSDSTFAKISPYLRLK